MRNNKSISISLPEEQLKKAKLFTSKTGRTLSGLIRCSLEEKLSENGK